MNTRKLIVYGFIVFMIFMVGFLIYMAFFQKDPETIYLPPPVSPVPTFLPSPTIFRIGYPENITASGVSMDNFYKYADEIMSNNDVIVRESRDYQFVYFAQGDYFLLSINNSPFEEARSRAENEILKILKINEDVACRLGILVVTPRFANPDYAGHNYQLSFCQ